MAKYWVAFRIENNATYSKRYDALLEAMKSVRNGSWVEPTSFFLMTSDHTIDAVAKSLAAALSAKTDLMIIGDAATDNSRVFGKVDHPDVLSSIAPFALKVT